MLHYYKYFLVLSSVITIWLNNINDTYQELRRSPEYPSGRRLFPTLVIFCDRNSFILNWNSILYSDTQQSISTITAYKNAWNQYVKYFNNHNQCLLQLQARMSNPERLIHTHHQFELLLRTPPNRTCTSYDDGFSRY
jgi:hypothetical protein